MKNGHQIFGGLALVLIVGFAATGARAAEIPATSAAGGGNNATILDKVYLNYFGIYHGASVTSSDSPYTLDQKGNSTKNAVYGGAVFFDSELTAAYMVDKTIGVGPVVPFLFSPVMGKGFTLGDVGIKTFNRKLLTTKDLNVYANLIVQAPTSQASQDRNLSWALKTTPNVRYALSGTRFAFGAWTEAKAYFGVTAAQSFKLYAAPYVNYQLTPSLSANLEYEMDARHFVGKPTFDMSTYETDLQPGLVWFITPKIMVNPYLQIYTGNTVSWDSTNLGAVISATVL